MQTATRKPPPWGFDPADDTFTNYARWAGWLDEQAAEIDPVLGREFFESLRDEQATVLYCLMCRMAMGDGFAAALDRRLAENRREDERRAAGRLKPFRPGTSEAV